MKTTIILLLISALVGLVSGMEITESKVQPAAADTLVITITSTMRLTTEERVVAVLRDSGFSRTMQRIILAQARHESGGFTNPLTRLHNNVFAMQHPGKYRKTTSLGPWGQAERRKGFASFSSIEESVRDYILYKKHTKILDKEDPRSYVYQLKQHRYFEANTELYVRAIKRWMNQDSTVRNFSTD